MKAELLHQRLRQFGCWHVLYTRTPGIDGKCVDQFVLHRRERSTAHQQELWYLIHHGRESGIGTEDPATFPFLGSPRRQTEMIGPDACHPEHRAGTGRCQLRHGHDDVALAAGMHVVTHDTVFDKYD